jgi:type IX secretion system PorP/SprF family membrane protein
MTKRSFYILLIIIAFASAAKAQQLPHYTQYLMNPFVINPAVAGIENYWDIKASHRHQWAGLQDAPVTSYLTAHGPLGNRNDLVTPTGSDIGYNPRGRAYWTDYESPASHPGMGLIVMNDVTGPIHGVLLLVQRMPTISALHPGPASVWALVLVYRITVLMRIN